MFAKILNYITELPAQNIFLFFVIFFFLCLFAGIGLPVNSDLLLISVGYLVYKQLVHFELAVITAIIGILTGDIIAYSIGKKTGHVILKKFSPKATEKASHLISRYGAFSIFVARFIPGFRTVIIITAGVMQLRFIYFIVANLLGAVIVIPSLLYAVSFFSGNQEKLDQFVAQFQKFSYVLLGVIGIFIVYGIFRFFWAHRKKQL